MCYVSFLFCNLLFALLNDVIKYNLFPLLILDPPCAVTEYQNLHHF
jgi:hypothetical protein